MPSTLPKVGSNGLWIPSQSMLSATPSSAYAQAKPQSKPPRDILYRAASEPRMLDGKTHIDLISEILHNMLSCSHKQQFSLKYIEGIYTVQYL